MAHKGNFRKPDRGTAWQTATSYTGQMSVLDPYSDAIISATVEAALKPVLQAADGFLSPSAEYLGHQFRSWLSGKIEGLKADSLRKIALSGKTSGSVSPKIGVRIVEGYSLEDDEWLRQSWSGLLASAAVEPQSVLPAFPEILRNISPDDAKLLDELYSASFASKEKEDAFEAGSFYGTQVRNLFVRAIMGRPETTPDTGEVFDRIATACQNLMRLRLITEETNKGLSLTILGYKLIRACRGPTANA